MGWPTGLEMCGPPSLTICDQANQQLSGGNGTEVVPKRPDTAQNTAQNEYLVRSQHYTVGFSTTYTLLFWPITLFSLPFYAGSAGFFGQLFYGDLT